jgi:type I restriction enzyme M protein
VDVDQQASIKLRDSMRVVADRRHTHLQLDALDEDLPVRLEHRSFDVALCNPPYLTLPWRQSFDRILSEAGLSGEARRSSGYVSAEMLFVAQILRLAGNRAEIGIIVPDGLVSGRRAKGFRRALLSRVNVSSVIQLPRGSFSRTDAQAYIVVFRNEPGGSGDIELARLETDGLREPIRIPRNMAEARMDHDFHRPRHTVGRSTFRLCDIGAEIVRGNLSSAEARFATQPVFHTTSFQTLPGGGVELPHDCRVDDRAGRRMARAGDILLARVDRNLHRKVCEVTTGSALLSDCVYAIRVPNRWRKVVLEALSSPSGGEALLKTSRGVGARMLSKADLLELALETT